MRQLIFKTLLATGLMMAAWNAQARDQLRLGQPAYGGTGCPAGSASVTLSPDQSALSILFDEYLVEAGGDLSRIDRKSCNIAIPVHVPQGYSVSIFQVDYRGYAYVPRGSMARFNVEYFFAGSRGPRTSRTFRGYHDSEYLIRDDLEASALVWSACGADVNLRMNSSMLAKGSSWGDPVLATVDSADVTSGIVYHIRWRRCR